MPPHWHSGILYLSPVLEHYGTGFDPLIPVPDWFRHPHFCSFRYKTDRMPDSPTFRHLKKGVILHVHTAGCGNGYTLHVHRQLIMVLSGTPGHGLVRHCPAMCSMFSYLWELLNPQGPPDEIVSSSCECSRSQRGTADPSLWISPASVFR